MIQSQEMQYGRVGKYNNTKSETKWYKAKKYDNTKLGKAII